ncbi:hypothetical protein ACIRSS_31580 [Amycolatopsis sp. NPDC101161]|uniref:hypothetical protein n=1 Tax=Amycolatopsis sp. NPDC101161 TaxID=3363940 RepID=UPI003820C840
MLSFAAEPGRAPLTTPIWDRYEPGGDVVVMTSPGLRKTRLIEAAGRFALCVQQQDGVYKYVSGEAYTDATDGTHGDNIAIVMRPERWNTSDFSDVTEQPA